MYCCMCIHISIIIYISESTYASACILSTLNFTPDPFDSFCDCSFPSLLREHTCLFHESMDSSNPLFGRCDEVRQKQLVMLVLVWCQQEFQQTAEFLCNAQPCHATRLTRLSWKLGRWSSWCLVCCHCQNTWTSLQGIRRAKAQKHPGSIRTASPLLKLPHRGMWKTRVCRINLHGTKNSMPMHANHVLTNTFKKGWGLQSFSCCLKVWAFEPQKKGSK